MKKIAFLVLYFSVLVSIAGQDQPFFLLSEFNNDISNLDLKDVHELNDLNPGFPVNWINKEDYLSTSLSAYVEGIEVQAQGNDQYLNQQQKQLLIKADKGIPIKLVVHYTHLNTVTQIKENRTIQFYTSFLPSESAQFGNGNSDLQEYLAPIVQSSGWSAEESVSIRFTINPMGKVDLISFNSYSSKMNINTQLIQLLQKMPLWKPAIDTDGNAIYQTFELRLGQNIGC